MSQFTQLHFWSDSNAPGGLCIHRAGAMAGLDDHDKYAHLLQPIKDMATNWNINIANELEEYMVRAPATDVPQTRQRPFSTATAAPPAGGFGEHLLLLRGRALS
jgi:hypothetical protein